MLPQPARAGSSRPTQRDVARLAGVSQATVSYVLTGGAQLNEATTARVRAAVKELGYTPNVLARGLRGVRTRLLGVIARDFRHPVVVTVIDALVREARLCGYEVIVSNTDASAPATLNLAALMKEQLCDGVALVGDVADEHLLWERYGDIGLPTVGVLQGNRDLPVANVSVDNEAGATLAMRHLIDLGHERIAFVGAGWIHGSLERLDVFQQWRSRGVVASEPRYVVEADNDPEGGVLALDRLWELPERPTAVFAATDSIAMGLLARAAELGIAVPRELSVVGFDDAPPSAFLAPALTTVRQPFEAIAREAVGVLVRQAEGSSRGAQQYRLAPTLSVRASTAPVGEPSR